LFKITTLKKTLDGLRGLDAKLESVLRRKLKGKGFTPLIGKRQDREEEDEKVENEDDSYGEEEDDAEDDGEDGEEEMEDEEMGSDDNVVDTDALLTKTE